MEAPPGTSISEIFEHVQVEFIGYFSMGFVSNVFFDTLCFPPCSFAAVPGHREGHPGLGAGLRRGQPPAAGDATRGVNAAHDGLHTAVRAAGVTF